ncbi:MAG TPA: choice-of-anchor Q domain-containing protein, partial [Thermoanaerobaculia bacterium]|nr:choice-of-anchor Q domain-containing protein [Thermoanaerobaculia bacterium]
MLATSPRCCIVPAAVLLAALLLTPGSLAAVIIVVNTADDLGAADDGFCSLREAVDAANDDLASGSLAGECVAGTLSDEIRFTLPVPSTIYLNYGQLVLTGDTTIAGPGSALLRIEALGFGRHFVLWQESALVPRTFALQGLELTGGWGVSDYQGYGAWDGGALLLNQGTVTLTDVVFADNLAPDAGAAIYEAGSTLTIERCVFRHNLVTNMYLIGAGGAIAANGGDLVIRDSTFEANEAQGDDLGYWFHDGHGGALAAWAWGSVAIERSTFVANRARGFGGAIAIGYYGAINYDVPTTITSSTFTLNEADTDGDGDDDGGGLKVFDNLSDTTLSNSLLAGNLDHAATTAPDLAGADIVTAGHNLIGIRHGSASATFPVGQPNGNGDLVGNVGAPLDARLLPLAANGGPTTTAALDAASPAIDQGSCPGEVADQRGYFGPTTHTRVADAAATNADDGCDIGAYEA